ncbi:MAG: hypothetical protein RDV41_09855, partial [Planctomycetota bacterium]|nr:hypothetical protein [Planctomycetota bacterium]
VDSATCANCAEKYSFAQLEDGFGRCRRCGGEVFDCTVIRRVSGADVARLCAAAFTCVDPSCISQSLLLPFVAGDGVDGVDLFYKMETILELRGLAGMEIIAFEKMSDSEKRSFIVSKKRAEIERCLPEDCAFCKRCDVIFKKYDNDWNQDGLCSKKCREMLSKTKT